MTSLTFTWEASIVCFPTSYKGDQSVIKILVIDLNSHVISLLLLYPF